ncbi:MAG: hypothetical protein ABIZ72_05995, partial [Candidatus Limnocylindrales bacterium]
DAVRPRVAIVSAGAGNPYGHPKRSTIERLVATGARVLRTDTDGSVAVSIAADGTIAVATTGARAASGFPRATGAPIAAAAAASMPVIRTARFSCGIPSGG